MQIDIDMKDLDKFISQELLKPVFMEKLKKQINESIDKFFTHYSSPVGSAINSVLCDLVKEFIRGDEMKSVITNKFKSDFAQELIEKLTENSISTFKKYIDRD